MKNAEEETITVIVVDDHYVVREGLRVILESAGIKVVAQACDGAQAVEAHALHAPDVCIIDVRMPKMDGIDAIARIRSADPEARIIALSSFEGDAEIKRALEAGASTYVLKRALDSNLPELVKAVAAGRARLGRQVQHALLAPGPRSDLTEREMEILQLVAEGRSNKEIAARLDISNSTVKNHVANILVRLGAADRTQAVMIAVRRGILIS